MVQFPNYVKFYDRKRFTGSFRNTVNFEGRFTNSWTYRLHMNGLHRFIDTYGKEWVVPRQFIIKFITVFYLSR